MRHIAKFVPAGLAMLAIAGCAGPASTYPSAARTHSSTAALTRAPWPITSLHYTANDNFSPSGRYVPGADGFNLADVDIHNQSELDSLPAGVRGLVWVGKCSGATPIFRSAVDAYAGDPKLFGFYVMDEPLPRSCPAANLLAEDNWIHAHVPGARTFAIMENLGPELQPSYAGQYTPRDSGLDLIGIDPYPVRSELSSPDYGLIAESVRLAEAHGWPESSIVPLYQAFGGGPRDQKSLGLGYDGKGYWVLPTTAQERQILADWAAVVPDPVFDYAYSWGSQRGDTTLSQSPALQAIFAAKNAQSKLP